MKHKQLFMKILNTINYWNEITIKWKLIKYKEREWLSQDRGKQSSRQTPRSEVDGLSRETSRAEGGDAVTVLELAAMVDCRFLAVRETSQSGDAGIEVDWARGQLNCERAGIGNWWKCLQVAVLNCSLHDWLIAELWNGAQMNGLWCVEWAQQPDKAIALVRTAEWDGGAGGDLAVMAVLGGWNSWVQRRKGAWCREKRGRREWS
jgi:hypothetical protein